MRSYEPVIRSFGRQAAGYDSRWRQYNDATLVATSNAIPWEQVKYLLDVGCGTGLLAERVRRERLGVRLLGVDLSRAMLQQGHKKMGAAVCTGFANALAEALPFAAGSFDAVVCANTLHYIRRPAQALEECWRVLRPGGWLVITDWCDDYLACKVCDWALRLFDRAHIRMYGMHECEALLEVNGFQVEMAHRFKIGWLWGLMTLRGRR